MVPFPETDWRGRRAERERGEERRRGRGSGRSGYLASKYRKLAFSLGNYSVAAASWRQRWVPEYSAPIITCVHAWSHKTCRRSAGTTQVVVSLPHSSAGRAPRITYVCQDRDTRFAIPVVSRLPHLHYRIRPVFPCHCIPVIYFTLFLYLFLFSRFTASLLCVSLTPLNLSILLLSHARDSSSGLVGLHIRSSPAVSLVTLPRLRRPSLVLPYLSLLLPFPFSPPFAPSPLIVSFFQLTMRGFNRMPLVGHDDSTGVYATQPLLSDLNGCR